MANIIMQDVASGSSKIQMRGDYWLSDVTDIASENVEIQNYKSGARFYCGVTTNDTSMSLLIDFSGLDVSVGSFNVPTGSGVIKKITSNSAPDLVLSIPIGTSVFRNQKKLEEISCKTVATATTAPNGFQNCNELRSINFLPNQCHMNLPLQQSSKLTDAGLVLLANGLYAGSPQTVTLHSTPKARCSTLMGTVSQVTENGETYDLFTQNDAGTVSLTNFITLTKGWTLA